MEALVRQVLAAHSSREPPARRLLFMGWESKFGNHISTSLLVPARHPRDFSLQFAASRTNREKRGDGRQAETTAKCIGNEGEIKERESRTEYRSR